MKQISPLLPALTVKLKAQKEFAKKAPFPKRCLPAIT